MSLESDAVVLLIVIQKLIGRIGALVCMKNKGFAIVGRLVFCGKGVDDG